MEQKAILNNDDARKMRETSHDGTTENSHEKMYTREDYTVGWICVLPIELAAAQMMRDEKHDSIGVVDEDTNSYDLGRIGDHNVVITGFPQGIVGISNAATVATNMTRSFPRLRFILLVGVGAGAPDPENTDAESDIRLGDVVVSKPSVVMGGAIQYDFGKTLQSGVAQNLKSLNKPPPSLLKAVARLEASHLTEGSQIDDILQETYQNYPRLNKKFRRPEEAHDVLFEINYEHVAGQQDCRACQPQRVVLRQPRDNPAPVVHYGLIASANQVMRDARVREKMRRELDVICFEMEAAGMMDDCPCLVVRGICDYADSHKNKQWQGYAALTAAAYAKELLQSMEASSVRCESVIDILRDQVEVRREHYKKKDKRYRDEKAQSCHRVFDVSDYEQQKNVNPDALPETCRWVLDHHQYHEWLRLTGNVLLWISADPGCGKSVLCKSLVDHWLQPSMSSLRETAETVQIVGTEVMPNQPDTVCYFFFKDNDEQSGLATAFCALLHQTFSQQPELIHHAFRAFETHKEDALVKNTDELWRIIQSVASAADVRPITYVLDGLDECRDGERQRLIEFLCQSCPSCTPGSQIQGRIKWLVTSRPHDDIQKHFHKLLPDVSSIHLPGENENDQIKKEIDLVIETRMVELRRRHNLSEKKAADIMQLLRKMENRTYLWLHLVMDDIDTTLRTQLVLNNAKISSLPTTVDRAYEKILQRITTTEGKQHAKTILTIIIGAQRPLNLEEMALALSIATSPELSTSLADLEVNHSDLDARIRHLCGLFVFVNHNRVYLIHQTAKEFLLRLGDATSFDSNSWKHCLYSLDVQAQMARICISFLCLSDFESVYQKLIDLVEDNPDDGDENNGGNGRDEGVDGITTGIGSFFAFASEYWANYTYGIEENLDKEVHARMMRLYDTTSERFALWTSVMRSKCLHAYEFFPTNSIQLASSLGHHLALRSMLTDSSNTSHLRGGDNGLAIRLAAIKGNKEVVQELLEARIDDHMIEGHHGCGRQAEYSEALKIASGQGHKQIVRMLLDAGADVNAKGGPWDYTLSTMAERSHERPQPRASSDRNIVVQISSLSFREIYHSALQVASKNGHEEVVKMLLDAGADVSAQGAQHQDALQAVSLRSHRNAAQVPHNAEDCDTVQTDGSLCQVLLVAARGGYDEAVWMLLDTRVHATAEVYRKMNEVGEYSGDALYAASERGHEKIVQLLLKAGSDVNARGGEHGDALQAASQGGHNNVVRMLRDAGASINVRGGQYGSALQAASACGHEKVVQTLLDAGADLNMTGALHYIPAYNVEAADRERKVALLVNDWRSQRRDREIGTVLQAASFGGHEKVAQMLLKAGADPKAQGVDYNDALQVASWEGHEKVVELLLEAGADINAQGEKGGSALFVASASGHEKVVQMLLDSGADVNAPAVEGGNADALRAALCQGHEKVAQMLVERGADVNAQLEYASVPEFLRSRDRAYRNRLRGEEELQAVHTRTIALLEKALGMEHGFTLAFVNMLGNLYWSRGRLEEAEQAFSRVLGAYLDGRTDEQSEIAVYGLTRILSTAVYTSMHDHTKVRTSLSRLVQHVGRGAKANAKDVDMLARALTYAKEQEDAVETYLNTIEVSNRTVIFAGAQCDGCKARLAFSGGRHVCCQCETVDLCSDCMAKYKANSLSLKKCHGHEFHDIGSAVGKLLSTLVSQGIMEVSRGRWLAQLREKYQALDAQGSPVNEAGS